MRTKLILLIFLGFICCLKSFSQIILDSTYVSTNKSNYELTLFSDGKFQRVIINSYCGVGYESLGDYRIQSDSLFLLYNEVDFRGPHIKDQIINSKKTTNSLQKIKIDSNIRENLNFLFIHFSIDDEFLSLDENTKNVERKHKNSVLKVYNYLYETITEIQLKKGYNYSINFIFEEKEIEITDTYKIFKAKKGKLILKDELNNKIKLSLNDKN